MNKNPHWHTYLPFRHWASHSHKSVKREETSQNKKSKIKLIEFRCLSQIDKLFRTKRFFSIAKTKLRLRLLSFYVWWIWYTTPLRPHYATTVHRRRIIIIYWTNYGCQEICLNSFVLILLFFVVFFFSFLALVCNLILFWCLKLDKNKLIEWTRTNNV